MRLCQKYKSGLRFFPATPFDEADLQQDFRADTIEVELRQLRDHESQGFSGILLNRALK